jgi:hypothetical protein
LPSWFFWSHLGPEFLCLLVLSVARMTTHMKGETDASVICVDATV